MYRKYRIVESIASSVSQYESYRDQVYRYTPNKDHHDIKIHAFSFKKMHLKMSSAKWRPFCLTIYVSGGYGGYHPPTIPDTYHYPVSSP